MGRLDKKVLVEELAPWNESWFNTLYENGYQIIAQGIRKKEGIRAQIQTFLIFEKKEA